MKASRTIPIILIALAGAAGGGWYYWNAQRNALPAELYVGNGRVESDQVDIAAKTAGRLSAVLVREGDMVQPGQVIARIDSSELEAQRAKYAADVAYAEAAKIEADATVEQRTAELRFKEDDLARKTRLANTGVTSQEALSESLSARDAARAILQAARQHVTAAERSVEAARALVALTEAQIADNILKSPVKGRILYKLANPGEVVASGGKVLTIVDLTQVYFELFIPSEKAIRLAIGAPARIVPDGANVAIPARVSFVSPDAQFTPKQVETRSERDKLMFRVRLRTSQSLIERHIDLVKTGARGLGYVWTGTTPPAWPDAVQQRLPGDPIDVEQ
ncbi:HlyD family secretion protein [Rhizobium oryzicola]|uniref:HlyD family efflux transporter periplasmic adaptor subunit n=1 Tax=Rhizobium oryzicola TaxID=1232668 RepID=A0ABT8SPM7_9HYPH|nr:HlyD family efflux transporter periplasmic adaptor subunit [Rhizobium oryzicola]MDO1580487.1 HlyD family efflux transporter periplasmic adaptor subunit [Rhizobium oryzicola]